MGGELHRRRSGGDPNDLSDLIDQLPEILADRTRSTGTGHLSQVMAPGKVTGELVEEIAELNVEAHLTELTSVPDDELAASSGASTPSRPACVGPAQGAVRPHRRPPGRARPPLPDRRGHGRRAPLRRLTRSSAGLPPLSGRSADTSSVAPVNECEQRWFDLGEFIREQRRIGQLSLRKLSRAVGHLEPVPEPDRAGPAPAVGRDPPADRPGAVASRPRRSTCGPGSSSAPGGHRRPDRRDPPRPATSTRTRSGPCPDLPVVPPSGHAVRADSRARAADHRCGHVAGEESPGLPSVGRLRAHPRRPVPAHLAAGPAGRRRQRRHERLRPRAGVGAGPGRRGVPTSTCGAGATTCPTWSRSSPASGWCTSTPGRADLAKEKLPEGSSTSSPTGVGRPPAAEPATPTPSTPTTGCRAWPATGSSTSSTLPLVSTFHTLARVKAETGDPRAAAPAGRGRDRGHRLLRRHPRLVPRPRPSSSSASTAPTPPRIEIVPPGVDHAFFSPGHPRRRPAGPAPRVDDPVLLFVGRIQPLKGARRGRRRPGRAVVRTRARRPAASSVGGPSGPGGAAEQVRLPPARRRAGRGRPRALRRPPAPPPAVHLLPGRRRVRRAQPVGVVRPGRPRGGGVRHAGGGGRRWAGSPRSSTTVAPACWSTSRDPGEFARPRRPSWPTPAGPASMAAAAAARYARGYTWSTTAARLRRLYADLTASARSSTAPPDPQSCPSRSLHLPRFGCVSRGYDPAKRTQNATADGRGTAQVRPSSRARRLPR